MWVDLTQTFHAGVPRPSVCPPCEFETILDVEEDGINIQQVSFPTHVGTHIDAINHFVPGGASIDELSLERFSGDGVVLDVRKDDPEEITVEDVESANPSIREDDVVILYTGWGSKYDSDAYMDHPWFSVDLAEYFVDRGIKMVGMDVLTPDLPMPRRPDGWSEFPVHNTLLENEIPIAENLANLDTVADQRHEIVGFPIKIRGGDAGMARFAVR